MSYAVFQRNDIELSRSRTHLENHENDEFIENSVVALQSIIATMLVMSSYVS